uniref:DUF4412 domain-containing protein n=1 Tax=Schlesneria paludicola TaxID=360056 RepID=A0A7C4LJ09_9PLAN
MFRPCWAVWLSILWVPFGLPAQELRVHTRMLDLTHPGERPAVLAHSLTLFHAGKVYDYISSMNEVTVYEPVHRRFTVLQVNAGVAAQVTQDEVRRFLALAEEQAEQQAAALVRQPEAAAQLQWLQFQLRPEFEVRIDAETSRLWLSSPRCRYEVEALKPPEPAVAEAYLKYADAVAELNAVLHPYSLLPAPRLQLNAALRSQNWLPRTVRRVLEADRGSDLRAEHEWKWRLEELDRKFIAQWEAQLKRSDLRWLPFKQQQREVLSNRLSQR